MSNSGICFLSVISSLFRIAGVKLFHRTSTPGIVRRSTRPSPRPPLRAARLEHHPFDHCARDAVEARKPVSVANQSFPTLSSSISIRLPEWSLVIGKRSHVFSSYRTRNNTRSRTTTLGACRDATTSFVTIPPGGICVHDFRETCRAAYGAPRVQPCPAAASMKTF